MKATCVKPASPLAENAFSPNQSGKLGTTDTPGLLRVSFFGPFYADYRVMLIDKDYSRALVGSGSADYLWILSRTSGLSETAKSELIAEARRRGYDTDKLIWVEQK